MRKGLVVLGLLAAPYALAQHCMSVAAASFGGWMPVASAPRDGRVVEMIETYGVAPWYGIFKWTKEMPVIVGPEGPSKPWILADARWVSAEFPQHSVMEDRCLFWRPYKSSGKYVDPTGGFQKSAAYWCTALHVPYDPKTGYCGKD